MASTVASGRRAVLVARSCGEFGSARREAWHHLLFVDLANATVPECDEVCPFGRDKPALFSLCSHEEKSDCSAVRCFQLAIMWLTAV
jgi:hypothetical protein